MRKKSNRKKHQEIKYQELNESTSFDNKINKIDLTLKVPTVFSVAENTEETYCFFEKLANVIKSKMHNNDIFIDSEHVQNATVDALIYLIVFLDGVKKRKLKYKIKGNIPKDKKCAAIYKESGFFNYVSSNINKIDKNTDKIMITHGEQNDPEIGKRICLFVMKKLMKEKKEISSLQKILIELMSNVFYHAYNNKVDASHKKWYIYTEFTGHSVCLIFFDTGLGIPETINTKLNEKMMLVLKKININFIKHSDLIHSAFKGEFRTRTKENNRGNGLNTIYKNVNKITDDSNECEIEDVLEYSCNDSNEGKTDDGLEYKSFIVMSGKGKYDVKSENGKNEYTKQLFGTMYILEVF